MGRTLAHLHKKGAVDNAALAEILGLSFGEKVFDVKDCWSDEWPTGTDNG